MCKQALIADAGFDASSREATLFIEQQENGGFEGNSIRKKMKFMRAKVKSFIFLDQSRIGCHLVS